MKNLVLIGGGHSHAIALNLLSTHPLANVRLTLITDTANAPYSGMLPGHVGGYYSFEESHINLKALAHKANAHWVLDEAIGLDLQQNLVLCRQHPPIPFDWLSIDIGSTPAPLKIPGAEEYTIPAKPVPQFLAGWNQLLQSLPEPQAIAPDHRPITLGIVGGGAGGVELALTMQVRLQHLPVTIHLFHKRNRLMNGASAVVSDRFSQLLAARGVQIHLQETVTDIEPMPNSQKDVVCQSGLRIPCDRIFWLTHASAAAWPQQAGLATDAQGFILVTDTLQSLSHPHVFATGDVAAMVNHPRPKAGVFAVRQGKPLCENLRRVIAGTAPKPFSPQARYLSLIGTGDGQAIAVWGALCFGPSRWLWYWKDRIDRQFMVQFKARSSLKLTGQ